MRTLNILIDSSTKPDKGVKSKYGRSSAFWCAIPDDINSTPCCMGVILRAKEGPNKIFYDGVISALVGCEKYRQWIIDVIIKGDNEHVIKQLKGEIETVQLKEYLVRTRDLESKFLRKIAYEYIGESNPIYKKVDQLAKWTLNHVPLQYSKARKAGHK